MFGPYLWQYFLQTLGLQDMTVSSGHLHTVPTCLHAPVKTAGKCQTVYKFAVSQHSLSKITPANVVKGIVDGPTLCMHAQAPTAYLPVLL